MSLETWELLSYVVTVVGLPLAIVADVSLTNNKLRRWRSWRTTCATGRSATRFAPSSRSW
jgi:hypothetical protein